MIVTIDKKIKLSPPIEEKQYLFHSEIIAIVKKSNDFGIIYYDIDNRLDLWSWSCVENILSIKKYIDFYELNLLQNSIYSFVEINKSQIKYITSTEDNLSQIVTMGKNLFFINNKSVIESLSEIKIDFKMVNIPLYGECYVNSDNIHKIKKEDYTTINPDDVNIYLNNPDKIDKQELFHIVFKDSSELTICDNSIDEIKNNIGETFD